MQTQTSNSRIATAYARAKYCRDRRTSDQLQRASLLSRVASERVQILEKRNEKGGMTYSVPSLGPAERDLLNAERFSSRTNNRLGSMYEKQQLEIARLVRWISTQGQNPEALIIQGRVAKLGKVPKSLGPLMAHWKTTEPVINAIRGENERRIIMAAVEAETALPMPNVPGLEDMTAAERQMRAIVDYPNPDTVFTPQVKAFCAELRSLAPSIEELEFLAMHVKANYEAREDIMRYTVELAEAYVYHEIGQDKRDADRVRPSATCRTRADLGR